MLNEIVLHIARYTCFTFPLSLKKLFFINKFILLTWLYEFEGQAHKYMRK